MNEDIVTRHEVDEPLAVGDIQELGIDVLVLGPGERELVVGSNAVRTSRPTLPVAPVTAIRAIQAGRGPRRWLM
jgi:hypothetical protein